jgi:molybdenum cofactor synthesis domain-containing protein
MIMKLIPVEKSPGMMLCHDITEIKPGRFKGCAFKKGHVITTEDVPRLLDLGKENIYAIDLSQGYVHENEAAERIAQSARGQGLELTPPSEGRVNLVAVSNGLLKIDSRALFAINSIEEIVFSTLHTNQAITAGKPVAGTRIIPLATREEKIAQVESICRKHFPLVEIKPFHPFTVGIITTGSEVYHGRIEDKFGPVVIAKFTELGSRILRQDFVSDDVDMTVKAIHKLLDDGADLIAVTGGMSVDPDDQTPAGIRAAGGKVITYGAPTFPGAMFLLAYIGKVPVVGLPGCVMYFSASVFDLVVPRILAGERPTREEIVSLGHGGFCAGCSECRYPVCPFGKSG